MKQTALHASHLQRSAKMTEFQGWQLPAHFTDPVEEYHAVRTAAGLFDVGFLGRIEVSYAGAEALVQSVFTRNIAVLTEGSAMYGILCSEAGSIIDTVLLFKLPPEKAGKRFLITTNAVNKDKVLAGLTKKAGMNVRIADLSRDLAQFALQGPRVDVILEALAGEHFKKIKQKKVKTMMLAGVPVTVSRTGFTGERGYELFPPAAQAVTLWTALLDAGKGFGLLSCGMTSRDMLRLESGYVQYGYDVDENRSPLEARLMPYVDLKKEFTGKDAIVKRKAEDVKELLVGFELFDKGVPRPGGTIFSENRDIGAVTSGNHSPHRRKDIGLGYVAKRYAQAGQEIEIEVKDREIAAKIVELPFYRRK